MRVVTDLVTRLEAGTLTEGLRQRLERGSARGLVGVIADPETCDGLSNRGLGADHVGSGFEGLPDVLADLLP